jgi:hypothetical protein
MIANLNQPLQVLSTYPDELDKTNGKGKEMSESGFSGLKDW